jgi:hypothetical protein
MKTIQFHYVAFKYAETQPDGHWFDKETLRFFKSRLPKVAYETDAGRFFITSEADPSGERRYTVREQLPNGNIETVGPFHVWKTQAIAKAKLTEVANAKWWTESLGRIELRIPLELARSCCHPGDCEADVLAAREHWLIVDQLARLVPSTVAEALKEYGAWSDEELADHDQNLTRLLWLACSDVAEEHVDA